VGDEKSVHCTSSSSDACIEKMLPYQISFVDRTVVVAGDFLLYIFGNGQMTLIGESRRQEHIPIRQMDIVFWMFHSQLFR
jgi:hypothetical protein